MIRIYLTACCLLFIYGVFGQHPRLTLTPAGVERIRAGMDEAPLFAARVTIAQAEVDAQLAKGRIDVPKPEDMAGGYTHERHKANYKLMYKAGNLYQITGEEKYAELVREMLLDYAKLYPGLSLHPTMRSYATGKIFWQCLNDANWLVFTSQAYDCIYDYLSADDRKHLEEVLFIPFADFLSDQNPKFFNRIHNHSTWANAAVGMIALVMDNDTLLNKALYGLANDGITADAFDNDGGFIKKEGVTQAGFLAQLDYSFSPDGYFAEGPYYLRYAIFPFLKFSQALDNTRPDLDIFNYRDGILRKAIHTLLLLTDSRGHFFPINDAQKGMSFLTYELITAVDLMYSVDPADTSLLRWAAAQGKVSLDESGFITARAIKEAEPGAPIKQSGLFTDGVSGNEGGVAVLRSGATEVLFKFSTQGMGHGHFDRLSYALYDDRGEVVQDYGAVRWVNIDQKAGGRYLPENKTFGKQTIGHNALVINKTSHFDGTVKKAEKAHPKLYQAELGQQPVQFISARENEAYPDADMQRAIFLVEDEAFPEPILIDIMSANTENEAVLDLPLWFMGDVMNSNFSCTKSNSVLRPMGTGNGYEHIWQQAACPAGTEDFASFNWMANDNFYTLYTATEDSDSLLLGRLGANDPNFNLRPDQVLIHRRLAKGQSTFVNLIEPHGKYSRVTEVPIRPYGSIESIALVHGSSEYTILKFNTATAGWTLYFSQQNADPKARHSVEQQGKVYQWNGVYHLEKTTN